MTDALPHENGSLMCIEDGNKVWRNAQGQLHRADGPAFERTDGHREWWVNSQRHRLDGPAVEYADGSKAWWVNGQLHRADGPAFEHTDRTKVWWYVNGRQMTEDAFNAWRDEQRRVALEAYLRPVTSGISEPMRAAKPIRLRPAAKGPAP